MFRPAMPIFGLVTDLTRSRRLLIAENMLLRKQLQVLQRQIKRPKLTWSDRAVMVAMSAITTTWHDAVLIVRPETILRRTNTSTAQQLRNVTPFREAPRFIIRDRDNEFGADFDRAAKGASIRVIRTALRAPLMNSVC
jgi:hypothetical protein